MIFLNFYYFHYSIIEHSQVINFERTKKQFLLFVYTVNLEKFSVAKAILKKF
jgi:hypothetical protein